MSKTSRTEPKVDMKKINRAIFLWMPLLFAGMGLIFFLPAGTINYPEAWGFLAVIIFPMIFAVAYFYKKDPAFLARRMNYKEKEKPQKLIVKISFVFFLFMYMIPGLDKRYGWSSVPWSVVIIADIIILLAYGFILTVFRENSYASRIVEVQKGQKVISTGPYAIVRHPMYLGAIIMWGFIPLALGSYWGMIGSIFVPVILIARIMNEEKVLRRGLPGYKDYMKKVKYRLIPGIW